MATTDASYSFTLKVKPSASNSYKIGIPFCPASFFDESTINLKIVWGDGSSDTELTTVASATDNILLEHTYSNAAMKTIEVHGGYGADSNFEGGKIAFPQSSKHDANGIAQNQAVPTGSTLDKIRQIIFEKVVKYRPVTGFYIHGQGDFQNFTTLWAHSTITLFRNFIWSSDPASEIKHVGDKNFGYICLDKTFENCHTGFAYTSDSNHSLYPTSFKAPLNGGGWRNASRRSKSFQRTFANSKVNGRISGWGPCKFVTSAREMFKDNTVFSRNINNLFATGNENSLTDMEGMFENTQAFSKHMLNWNTSKVTNMINVFKNSKYDRRLDTWDVSKVTSMKGFLEGNTDYASGDGGDYRDIKEWFDPYLNPDGSKRDASNPRTFAIESFEDMFKNSSINVDISTWDTSTVTNMKNVFKGNTAFDQDISDWDISNVSTENLDGFATGATGLTASEVPSRVPSPASVAPDPVSGGSWTQIGDDIDGEESGESSGYKGSLSINSDGTIVAIGSYKYDSNSGRVRVLENVNGTWTQIGDDIDDGVTNVTGLGTSLNSDGTIIAIGSPNMPGSSTYTGKTQVYQNVNGTWTQLGDDIDGEAASDGSGTSVCLNSDGTIVAIAAPANDQGGAPFSSTDSIGQTRIFEYNSTTQDWEQVGDDIYGEGQYDQSGGYGALSLNSDGTIVAIGSHIADNENGDATGHVRVYENVSGTWTQIGDDIDGEAVYDFSGRAVSLNSDGTIVAIGGFGNDANGSYSGYVRIFENVNGTWTQIGDDIEGETEGDKAGHAVSLNSDGTIVAIGSPQFYHSGDMIGYVSVFENVSGTWTQIGDNIVGEAVGDSFGHALSLNSDGTIVAIGAPGNDAGGTNSGHVRVFEFSQVYTEATELASLTTSTGQYDNSFSLQSGNGEVIVYSTQENPGVFKFNNYSSGSLSEVSELSISNSGAGDSSFYIYSINYDGTRVAVQGKRNFAGSSNGYDSFIRVYEYANGSWSQLGSDLKGIFDMKNWSSSTTYSIGDTVRYSGVVYNSLQNNNLNLTPSSSSTDWEQTDFVPIFQKQQVSLNHDGDIISIGDTGYVATSGHESVGRVQVYKLVNGSWTQLGSDITGQVPTNQSHEYDFGTSVKLNAAGDRIIITDDRGHDSNSSVSHPDGLARVYEYANNSWSQLGSDIFGNFTFDYASSINATTDINNSGDTIAILYGASKSGYYQHIKVFKYSNSEWNQVGSNITQETTYYTGTGNAYSINYSDGLRLNGDGDRLIFFTYGAIHIYDLDNNAWSNTEDIVHPEEENSTTTNKFKDFLAGDLSDDGERLTAVGYRTNKVYYYALPA